MIIYRRWRGKYHNIWAGKANLKAYMSIDSYCQKTFLIASFFDIFLQIGISCQFCLKNTRHLSFLDKSGESFRRRCSHLRPPRHSPQRRWAIDRRTPFAMDSPRRKVAVSGCSAKMVGAKTNGFLISLNRSSKNDTWRSLLWGIFLGSHHFLFSMQTASLRKKWNRILLQTTANAKQSNWFFHATKARFMRQLSTKHTKNCSSPKNQNNVFILKI